ncbi:hypothetical protein [Chloracidobacterium aggregatum]|uniref:Secreted protein n=1 Tax=Chloracidobacterium sp. N TaxID=2821540 RepID=A0ABX8B3I7_9BACT|nr:hypothetical protein [Chloracidobacterium aggregatum]QUV86657.1 hypothetical protein J8C03_13655 [Chloracidobacterium sp. 2]QUV92282.1 hypothetical protein J8C04_15390 [Chloracidobacterium sp. A]QUV95558.1 hypothetical protein J8C05_12025 [Chloracidobacterium sp. N]QUV98781.1 hypothetical protein J8C00_13255 [Chloracidobacterium sp. E]
MRCFSMWRRCACPVVVITGFVGITSGNVPPQRQRDPRGVRQGIRKRLHQRGERRSRLHPRL